MNMRGQGYLRPDGRVGVRNHLAVVYTVECAHHVAERIARRMDGAQVLGFAGCYADPYASRMLVELASHPNVAAALFVRLGCESTDVDALAQTVAARGRAVEVLSIQAEGGTVRAIERGVERLTALGHAAEATTRRVPLAWRDLVVGVECGGSDATSGLSANPATGWAVDRVVDAGGTAIFSELPELLGCDDILAGRAANDAVGAAIRDGLRRAEALGRRLGTFALSTGNLEGGLTTIEEKSLGALAKAGSRPIAGVLRTAERPPAPGLFLLDKVGDVDGTLVSHYEENDNDGLVTLLAAGAQILWFTTGRGSVVGSVLAPVVKICGNPRTSRRMADNVDVDAGPVIEGTATIAAVGERIVALSERVAAGEPSRAEALGHEEYWLTYKPGRACDVL
jgi:altronate dehydratase large subunit